APAFAPLARGGHGVGIAGAGVGARAGAAAAPAGSFAGSEGLWLAVGAPGGGTAAVTHPGSVYVVPLSTLHGVDLADPASGALRIDGIALRDGTGTAVADAGDVNGDGRDDLLVGVPDASSDAGAAFVLYGGQAGPIELGSLTAGQGVRLAGPPPGLPAPASAAP